MPAGFDQFDQLDDAMKNEPDEALRIIQEDLLDSNINNQDSEGHTYFHIVCKYARTQPRLVRTFITTFGDSIDVNKQDNEGYTPFHVACIYDDPDESSIVLLMIDRFSNTIDTALRASDGNTAFLELAEERNHIAITRMVRQFGQNIQQPELTEAYAIIEALGYRV